MDPVISVQIFILMSNTGCPTDTPPVRRHTAWAHLCMESRTRSIFGCSSLLKPRYMPAVVVFLTRLSVSGAIICEPVKKCPVLPCGLRVLSLRRSDRTTSGTYRNWSPLRLPRSRWLRGPWLALLPVLPVFQPNTRLSHQRLTQTVPTDLKQQQKTRLPAAHRF